MNLLANTFFFCCLVMCTCCVSYTKGIITTGDQTDTAVWSEKMKPGKTYKVTLVTGREFMVRVSRVTADSLYGSFHFRQHKTQKKLKTQVAFHQIADVKAGKVNVITTAIVVSVPVALLIIAVQNMTFDFGSEPIF